jgi:hypothetical protein
MKGARKVPTATKSVTKFTYTPNTGTAYTLPLLGKLKPADLQRFEDTTKPLTGIKTTLDRYAPGLFDAIEDADELNDFMQSWQKASGIEVGESSASTDS